MINKVMMGGPDVNLFQVFGSVQGSCSSWKAGNLESLGGLSPQAKTLGQDKIARSLLSATIQVNAGDKL